MLPSIPIINLNVFFFTSFFPLRATAHVYFCSVDINTMPKHNHSLWQTQRIINIKITCFPPGEQSVPVTFQTRCLCVSYFLIRSGVARFPLPNHAFSVALTCVRLTQTRRTVTQTLCVYSRVRKWSFTLKKRKQQSLSCVNIFLLKYSVGHIVLSTAHDDNVAKAAGKKGE